MKTRIIAILFLISLISCKNSTGPNLNQPIKELKFIRFEKELFEVDTANIGAGVYELFKKYPVFSRLYFGEIMGFSENFDSLDQNFLVQVKDFVSGGFNKSIMNRIDSLYGDFSQFEKEFNKTQAYAKYYFPESKPVEVYTMFSRFYVGNIIFSNTDSTDGLGVSLDFFLGNDYNYKFVNPHLEVFSNYHTRTFNRDHLLKKSWAAFADDQVKSENVKTVLSHMIYEAKKLYLLKKIIPNIQDTVLFEFSANQLDWCRKNRMDIWSFLIDKQILNSGKANDIMHYINPGPTTTGMPKEAPGRVSIFIGYEIIEAFMSQHKDLTLADLLKESDAQKILNDSKYKPRNN